MEFLTRIALENLSESFALAAGRNKTLDRITGFTGSGFFDGTRLSDKHSVLILSIL